MDSPKERVRSHLGRWAESNGIKVNANAYVHALQDNLFQSLHPDTLREFESADG